MYNNNDLINELIQFTGMGMNEEQLKEIVNKYKTIKLEEKYDKSDFSAVVDDFLEAKRLEGLAEGTLYGYKLELNLFNKEIRLNISDIDVQDIRKYVSSLKEIKNSTVTKKIHALRSFFSWLIEEEIIEKNPMSRIRLPKKEKRISKAFNESELEEIRDKCDSLRMRAMVEVMYSTGCRISEVADMKISDINHNDKSCYVIGKGDKERNVLFSDRAFYHLNKYLTSRDDDCESLFVTERKPVRKMTKAAIQREVRKLNDKTDISKNIHSHCFRHSFSTAMIEAGANVMVVKELLGHSSLMVTDKYVEISEMQMKTQHKKCIN